MMKSNKILAGVGSSAQSELRPLACKTETLPELPVNWVDANASSLRKPTNPEKAKYFDLNASASKLSC